jgi:transposase
LYSHIIFGRSTEKTSEAQAIAPSEKPPVQDSPLTSNDNDDQTVPTNGDNQPEPELPQDNVHHISRHPKRKRGAQPGHKGHGRTIPEDLPVIRKIIMVPEDERFCPICGKEDVEVPFTENSTQIEVKLELFRVEYVRERIKRTCDCVYAGNRFITAPQPPQAIEKRKFGHNLLSLLVVLKYLFAIPLQRLLTILGMQGAVLSSGSITGAFKKLQLLLLQRSGHSEKSYITL